MKKRVNTFHLMAFLFAVVAAVGLVSCGSAKEQSEMLSEAQSEPQSAGSSISGEDSSVPGSSLPEEAVVSLECFDVQDEVLCVRPAGENRAALVCGTPAPDLYDGSFTNARLYVIDVSEDTIVFESEYDADEQLLCVRENGTFVTLDYIDQVIHVYGSDMRPVHSFAMPEGILQADVEEDCLYLISRNEIARIGFDGASESAITFPYDVDVYSFDSGHGRAIASVNPASDTESLGTAIYSEAAGGFVFSTAADVWASYFAGDKVVSVLSDDRYDEEGNLIESLYRLTVCDFPDGSDSVCFLLPNGANCTFLPQTEYFINSVFPCDDENDVPANTRFYILNAAQGEMSTPIAELEGALFIVPEYLESCGRIIVGACFSSDEGVRSRLLLIRPEAVEMTEKLDRFEMTAADPELHTLSQELLPQRESADDIEKEFGVRILLGDECLDAAANGSFSIVSTEDREYADYAANPEEELTEALNTLRRSLEYYPKSFFDSFKNYAGEGGVRFLIVRDMVNENGSFAGGLHYQYGAWYNVVLDVDEIMSVHHELWHAAEQRITNEFAEAFSDIRWSELNPEDFSYCYDFDNYYQDESVFEYIIPWDDDPAKRETVYFDQIYSTMSPYEDRATLVEDLLNESFDPDLYGFADPMERICAYPHLREKLEYMAEQTERTFGYVYWKEVLQNIMKMKEGLSQ